MLNSVSFLSNAKVNFSGTKKFQTAAEKAKDLDILEKAEESLQKDRDAYNKLPTNKLYQLV